MGNNPSYFKYCQGSCLAEDYRQYACTGSCPVEMVSWWDAVAYCNALSKQERLEECYELSDCKGTPGHGDFECGYVRFKGIGCLGYRLPTEAEWEYAARAGTTTATYTGGISFEGKNNAPELDAIAWYGGNSGVLHDSDDYWAWDCSKWPERAHQSSRCATHMVGLKQRNAWGLPVGHRLEKEWGRISWNVFGLYDMLGNVWEWVQDWYHDSYEGAPLDGSAWESPAGEFRVIRGGSWASSARAVRSASRGWAAPTDRYNDLGIRVARSLP